jgi:hypothetical protein
MSDAKVQKFEVALELLERAIELYLRRDSYYSALHLGGAAEEVLAGYAREVKTSPTTTLAPAFDQFKAAVLKISGPSSPEDAAKTEKWVYDRMTEAKNSVKHKRGKRDRAVSFDPREEAYDVIDRAITTYFQLFSVLGLRPLQLIEKFDARRRQEQQE